METLFSILLFVIMITSNANATCTKGLEPNGELESEKNGRDYYYSNQHLSWDKCTLVGHRFVIEIYQFDLERRWGLHCDDYLKITDKKTNKIVLNRCGFYGRSALTSDSNEIRIEFHSDKFQSNNKGFKLRWWSEAIITFGKDRTKAVTTFQKETKAGIFTKLLQTERKERSTTATQFDTVYQSNMKQDNRKEAFLNTESSKSSHAFFKHSRTDKNSHTVFKSVTTESGTSLIIPSTVHVSDSSISKTKYDYETTSVDLTIKNQFWPSTNIDVKWMSDLDVTFTSNQTDDEKYTTQTSGHGTNQGSSPYLMEGTFTTREEGIFKMDLTHQITLYVTGMLMIVSSGCICICLHTRNSKTKNMLKTINASQLEMNRSLDEIKSICAGSYMQLDVLRQQGGYSPLFEGIRQVNNTMDTHYETPE